MKDHSIGILGCGVISRTYAADIKAFYRKLHISACADVLPESAKKLAEEFGIPKACTPEELLADREIEIVVNLTPPQFHVELNRKIIAAGKHLFSEKPFAQTVREAEELAALAAEKGVMIGSAPDTFLASGLQSMRYYLDAGLIGKPFFLTANMTTFGAETWHPNPAPFYRKGSGPLYDMAPYYLSAIVALLGPVESAAAFSAKPFETRHVYTGPGAGGEIPAEIPTTWAAILRLRSGAIANLNVSFDTFRTSLPMFEICGDCGTLSYPDPNFGGGTPKVYRKEQYTDTIWQHTPEAEARRETFRELPELFTRVKDYSRGIGVLDLAAAIERKGRNRANGEMIIHITEIIEGLMKSAETGAFVAMRTTCERPEPLKPGSPLDAV